MRNMQSSRTRLSCKFLNSDSGSDSYLSIVPSSRLLRMICPQVLPSAFKDSPPSSSSAPVPATSLIMRVTVHSRVWKLSSRSTLITHLNSPLLRRLRNYQLLPTSLLRCPSARLLLMRQRLPMRNFEGVCRSSKCILVTVWFLLLIARLTWKYECEKSNLKHNDNNSIQALEFCSLLDL